MQNPRDIKFVAVHCADTPNGRPQSVADIDSWHVERGFHRSDSARKGFNPTLKAIGYHYVIYVDGSLHTGRAESEVGAHVEGYNSVSIGICMIGATKFTPAQWGTLNALLHDLKSRYPNAKIQGHRDFPNVKKSCPGFSVAAYFDNQQKPLVSALLTDAVKVA